MAMDARLYQHTSIGRHGPGLFLPGEPTLVHGKGKVYPGAQLFDTLEKPPGAGDARHVLRAQTPPD